MRREGSELRITVVNGTSRTIALVAKLVTPRKISVSLHGEGVGGGRESAVEYVFELIY